MDRPHVARFRGEWTERVNPFLAALTQQTAVIALLAIPSSCVPHFGAPGSLR